MLMRGRSVPPRPFPPSPIERFGERGFGGVLKGPRGEGGAGRILDDTGSIEGVTGRTGGGMWRLAG